MSFVLKNWMDDARVRVEAALRQMLDGYRGHVPELLHESMSYSLLAGGKRIRPLLVLGSAEACAGASASLQRAVMDAAVAIEMVHTYSLIHDDLPSMDNDDLRRGLPTNHRKFSESTAILAGDGLLTEVFAVLAKGTEPCRTRLCALFAKHSGARGMVGGQVDDTSSEREDTVAFLDRINRRKTGDLLALSCAAGACAAGADETRIESMARIGYLMGHAFQQWDDVLDVEGDPALMGKATGNDAQQAKLTYPRLIGLDETRRAAHRNIDEARALIEPWMPRAEALMALAGAMVDRKS
ncbi:MAG: polyprenyl synthetase family protein [Myxococcales bacterium]|jgi:geranylgeranyl diphosphate synthase type II|nr:polyprenyl synthetase family protein [Myxococcales bacterium]